MVGSFGERSNRRGLVAGCWGVGMVLGVLGGVKEEGVAGLIGLGD